MAWLLPSDRTLGICPEMDSTVVEADVRSPTDSGLASDGVRVLAREGKRLAARAGGTAARARDRSRAVGKRLRAIGQDVEAALGCCERPRCSSLASQTGRPLAASAREARRLAAETRSKARALARSRNAKTRCLTARILAGADRFETLVARTHRAAKTETKGEAQAQATVPPASRPRPAEAFIRGKELGLVRPGAAVCG